MNQPTLRRSAHRPAVATVALLLAAGSLARAATPQREYYVDVYGGLTTLDSGDVIRAGSTTQGAYDRGFLAGAAFGKQVSSAWAIEVEWFYRSNEVESMKGGDLDGVNDGDFASTNLMFNAVYTFGQGGQGGSARAGISTYVGLGIGFMQEVDIDLTIGGVEEEHSDNWVPSAQLMAGVLYPVNDRFSAFLELRYHYAGSPKMDATDGGDLVEADYNGVSATLGLRYAF
jgi:opacity protein-like surface antigen